MLQACVKQSLYESVRNQDELDAEYVLVFERLGTVRATRDAQSLGGSLSTLWQALE